MTQEARLASRWCPWDRGGGMGGVSVQEQEAGPVRPAGQSRCLRVEGPGPFSITGSDLSAGSALVQALVWAPAGGNGWMSFFSHMDAPVSPSPPHSP